MSGLPVVQPRQLIGALGTGRLRRAPCSRHHYCLRHPDRPGMLITVPFHNRDLKRGTLHAILRRAERGFDDLRRLL